MNDGVPSNSDLFKSFNELSDVKHGGFEQGKDFDVEIQDLDSDVIIIGIHAGKIEKMTSEIVKAISGEDLSYYLFEGKLPEKNSALHLSSHTFDEPQLEAMLTKSDSCVSIDGFKEETRSIVSMGGQNKRLCADIFEKLKETGLLEQDTMTPDYKTKFFPEAKTNIANKTKLGGVQIEISMRLRERMQEDIHILEIFCNAIREAIIHGGGETKARLHMEKMPYTLGGG